MINFILDVHKLSKQTKMLRKFMNLLHNQCQTVLQLFNVSGIAWSMVQKILIDDLGMKRVAAKFVLWYLTDHKKRA